MNKPFDTHPEESVFHEYLDDALPEARRKDFEEHLETCVACTEQLAQLQGLFAQIEGLPEMDLGGDLTNGIFARIGQKQNSLKLFRWTLVAETLGVLMIALTAWPLIELALDQIGLQAIALEFTAPALDLSMLIAETFSQLSNWLAEISSSLIPTQIQTNLATIYLIPLVVSAGLLMLIGNQFLLKDINTYNHHEIRRS